MNATETRYEITETLAASMRTAADLDAEIGATERDMAEATARAQLDAFTARDEAGKLVYSNEESRKAAAAQAVSTDATCRELAARLDELKRRRAYAEADASMVRNSIRLTVARLMATVDRL